MVAVSSSAVATLVERLEPDLIALRRDLHRHPELGFAEERTASIVAEAMQRVGLQVHTGVGGTGVVADLKGEGSGPILLIRAELDALAITETAGRAFASTTPGVMHACGHDAHMSALVGTAMILSEMCAKLSGTVRFCFQPAEEILAGAEQMISDGATEGVDFVLGTHVLSTVPFGTVVSVPGPFLSGADFFKLSVIGSAGHGGMPHLSVDAIFAAAQVVTALQSIVARETEPSTTLVVSINAIEGEGAANVVAEEVVLRGNVRWFSETERERVLHRIPEVARAICKGLRASVSFTVDASAPVAVNSSKQLDLVEEAVVETDRSVIVNPGPLTFSDDFARLLEIAPGAFIGIGAGGPDAAPHHHPRFDIDERAIALMTEVLVRTALRTLS
ncbi:MAG: amidohydrolase [Actinomycetota bacterium]|nr:amidohydrolase [Actinomycetota bacterium]